MGSRRMDHISLVLSSLQCVYSCRVSTPAISWCHKPESHPSDSVPNWCCHPRTIPVWIHSLSCVQLKTWTSFPCFIPVAPGKRYLQTANASVLPKGCFNQGSRGVAPISHLRCGCNKQRFVTMGELQPEKPVLRRGMFLLSQKYIVAFYLILQAHSHP